MVAEAAVERFYQAAREGDLAGVALALRTRAAAARCLKAVFDPYDETALHAASSKGHLKIVRLLLDSGANIGKRDADGETPLHYACQAGNLEVVKELIRRGADIYAEDGDGDTPLDDAARYSPTPAVAEYVLQHYQEKIFEREGSRSLLTILEEAGNFSEDRVLLPIGTLSTEQMLAIMRYFVEQDPDSVCERDIFGELPIHVACREHALFEVIQWLLEQDSSTLNVAADNGDLPIHLACRLDTPRRVIKYLIEQDPDSIRKRDGAGNLPLHIVVYHCEDALELIRFLLDQDPTTLHMSNNDGSLPIHVACRARSEWTIIKYLVEQNGGVATLCARDNRNGALPLHVLCGLQNPALKAVEYLVKTCPAALSTRTTRNGNLPVTLACESASLSVIYSLVRGDPQVVST